MSPIRTLDPMLPLGDSRSCSRRPTRVLPCPQGTLTGKLDPMACGELPRYAEDLKHSLLQAGERSLRSEVNHICTVQKLNDFMRPREATLPEEWRLSNGPSCVRIARAGNSQHGSFCSESSPCRGGLYKDVNDAFDLL